MDLLKLFDADFILLFFVLGGVFYVGLILSLVILAIVKFLALIFRLFAWTWKRLTSRGTSKRENL